jgi:hypothetical protein
MRHVKHVARFKRCLRLRTQFIGSTAYRAFSYIIHTQCLFNDAVGNLDYLVPSVRVNVNNELEMTWEERQGSNVADHAGICREGTFGHVVH